MSPRLSGADCVARLLQLGFRVTRKGRGVTFLERRGCHVLVPDLHEVDGALLEAILRSAAVDAQTFSALRTRSGVYTKVSDEIPPTTARGDAAPSDD